MWRLQSAGLVCRILSLSAILSLLILFKGAKPSEGSQQTPPTIRAIPSPPPQPLRHEFLHVQGRHRGLTLAKDEVHAYLFDLEPDDFVDIEVDQKGLDVTAHIYAPGGEPPLKIDRWNGLIGRESIPLLARVSGRYRVELTGEGRGTYQIRICPKRKARPVDRQNAAGAMAFMATKPKAEQDLRKALAFWEASGFREGQADAAYELGRLLSARGAKSEALRSLDKAFSAYHSLRNLRQEAAVLNLLGAAYAELGTGHALPFYERALRLARMTKDSELEAAVLYDRGRLYSKSSEFEIALKDLASALAIQHALREPIAEAKTLNALGNVYSSLEQTDIALSFCKNALNILKDQQDAYLSGLTFASLGDIYQKRGDSERAILDYERSFALLQNTGHSRDETTVLNNLATAYFSVGRYPEALNAFQLCQKIFESLEETSEAAVAWANSGWVLASMERYKDAFVAYSRALAMVRGRKRPLLEVEAYHGLAWAEWRQGRLNSAREVLGKALAAMELLRTKADRAELRSSFLAGRQGLYDLLVEILMAQQRREPGKRYDILAFEASERARSRTLLDELEGRPVLPALSLRDIQQQVLGTEDVVLLEYFLGDKRSYLWVVTATSFASYELPASGSQIVAGAREVYSLQEASKKLELRSNAIRKSIDLSRLLFGQLGDRLQGKKLLIVAPPALQYISFGALPEDFQESRWQGSAWPRTLTMDHEITVELSATVLATLRRLHRGRRRASKPIAVLADPVFSTADERVAGSAFRGAEEKSPSFPRLQYSQSEAAAIAAQVTEGKPLLALGFSANRQDVLAGILKGYNCLHFSTHGVPDGEKPDRSAIVLSLVDREGKPIEGRLRAGEIAKLELPADLVVLSACRTGLGREVRGEGLVGLTQAFFCAGASRVMVSLWNVDDQATASLMGHFYQNLFQAHLSPAAALKEAQVWMWRQPRWNAPTYWAGFVLQGEWK
jgi:CHAT domain-containing protein/Tfp pilus assembly protein PilF